MEKITEYKAMKLRKTKLKNLGYRYQGNLLKDSLSSLVYNSKSANEFLKYVELVLNHLIYAVKSIKKNNNYMVDKDTDFIN